MTKMTIASKFDAIKAMVATDATFADGTSVADFIDNEIAKVNKKNSGKKKTATKTQKANAEMFADIVDAIKANDGTMTAKAVAEKFGVTSQKISGVIKANDKDAIITKGKTKDGVTYTVAVNA